VGGCLCVCVCVCLCVCVCSLIESRADGDESHLFAVTIMKLLK
jgi:hypothetical protein